MVDGRKGSVWHTALGDVLVCDALLRIRHRVQQSGAEAGYCMHKFVSILSTNNSSTGSRTQT